MSFKNRKIQIGRKATWVAIIIIFSIALYLPAQQSVDTLKKDIKKIENNIKYTNKLLAETTNKKKRSINDINLINKQISYRQELIKSYSTEISNADSRIVGLKQNIDLLQHDLVALKKLYGELIYQSYKARNSTDIWVFIFSSKTIYQAYSRIKYIQQANQYKRAKARQILAKQGKISNDIAYLNQVKQDRQNMISSKENENKSLLKNKNDKQKMIESLKGEEKNLSVKLKKQQSELSSLNDRIQKIIEEQIKKTTPTTAQSNPKGPNPKPTTKTKPAITMSPEEEKLSASFALNKGKLPWPLVRGVIVSRFGPHVHEVLQINVDNKGVDFRTDPGASAMAVFDGTVVDVVQITRYKAVIIRHGNFLTVYSNLVSVSVAKGDKVKTKQAIGKVMQDADDQETILHFEVWNGGLNRPENPENWLL